MSSQFKVIYTVPTNAATVKGKLRIVAPNNGPSAAEQAQRIASYTDAMASGAYQGVIGVALTAVQATGTITFSSIANNDTITVNGVVFTAKTSGATGNQFNLGSSDTTAAANAAAALNASSSFNVSRAITATSSGAVITITAITPGNMGNMGTLAISAHGSVSGANLTGGSEDSLLTLPLS